MNSTDTAMVFIAAFALVLGIIIVANIGAYRNRKLKSEERLAAIAKGLPLPPDLEIADETSRISGADQGRGIRTGGLVLVSIGVGLGLLGLCLEWILQERDVLAVSAAGLIPLAVGIGLVIDYALRNRPPRPESD